MVHNNVPAKFITTQSLVGVKATGNSRSGISGNSPRQKFPAGIPEFLAKNFWEFWNFGFLVISCCELRKLGL